MMLLQPSCHGTQYYYRTTMLVDTPSVDDLEDQEERSNLESSINEIGQEVD